MQEIKLKKKTGNGGKLVTILVNDNDCPVPIDELPDWLRIEGDHCVCKFTNHAPPKHVYHSCPHFGGFSRRKRRVVCNYA